MKVYEIRDGFGLDALHWPTGLTPCPAGVRCCSRFGQRR